MIEKYWIDKDKKTDKIIIIGNQTIFKADPKPENFFGYYKAIKDNVIPKGLFGIPFAYLKEIRMQDGKGYLEIIFSGNATERIKVKKQEKKEEIFNYFKDHIPKAKYELDKHSALKAAKKPIIALIVLGIIYALSIMMAIGLKNGELEGEQLMILLGFASLGVKKLSVLFGGFILITIISIIVKMKNPPSFHKLKF